MAASLRKASAFLVAPVVAFILLASVAWWSIHTGWFASLIRIRIVSTLQKATGGRVELHGFSFDPDTLHSKISGLVLHGTESQLSPPLLSIGSVDIALKMLSVWRQGLDLQSIVLTQPEIHLVVNPDGTTNIPSPKRSRSNQDTIQQLLDLKVKHFQVVRGLVQINNQKLPLNFSSRDIGLLLNYDYAGPSYGFTLHSSAVNLELAEIPFQPMEITSSGRLFQDHADIQQFQLLTAGSKSTIELAGKLQHFAQPFADANVKASLSIDELAKLGGINQQLRNGRGSAVGAAHLDIASGKFTFTGKADAQGVDLVIPGFSLLNMNGASEMFANNDGMLLRHAEATARGAHFSGEGSIRAYNFLQVNGHVSQVALQEVGAYLTRQPFPWSGAGYGTVYASARLMEKEPDFTIGAKLQIDEGKGGIPTSGNVDVTFHARGNGVDFIDSTLHLPHSTADFSGSLNTDLLLKLDTSNLADLDPLIPILGARIDRSDLPEFAGGIAHFDGALHNSLSVPSLGGDFAVTRFKFRNYSWDSLSGQIAFAMTDLSIPRFQLHEDGASLAGSASARLTNWSFENNSPLHFTAHFSDLDLVKTAALFTTAANSLPIIKGVASGNLNLQGTWDNPNGDGSFRVTNLDAYNEQLNQVQFDAVLNGNRLQINKGRVQSGPAVLGFSGVYQHSSFDWSTGDLNLKADTNGFPLSSLSTVRKFIPALNARAEVHLDALGKLHSSSFEPLRINGSAEFQNVSLNGRDLGNASLRSLTQGNSIDFTYSGDLKDTKFHGAAKAQLAVGTPIRGDLQMDRISLATLKSLASEAKIVLPLDGFLNGSVAFDGLLEDPVRMHARATIKELQISSTPRLAAVSAPNGPDIVLRNNEPILVDVSAGVLNISRFEIDGRDTSVNITGFAPFLNGKPMEIRAVGKADLALFQLFDPNVRSSGSSELAANISGPITAPTITGALQVRNGSFFLSTIPNGLSDVNGTVVFSRNRATIQKMSGHSGGGDISLGGSLSFGQNSALVYHLEAAARNVRVRYANSISVTANSDLRLSGTSINSVLSGTLTVTRVVFTPNADAGNLLAAASSSGAAAADQGDFISGLHLDVAVESAPNLQVSTNLSRDVEAEIQLRLRGTPDHPIVLGNITANQGDIKIFGTRFSLNRGEVSFVNTIRVEPVLDLDLETRARGVTVDITVSGTPSKLNFNYRSDPPLQPRDIIALLTVGRAPGVGAASNSQGGSDVSALSSGVNSVLGQAISPVSNRLSKLFGITNIKIDPFVQGTTNTPQARLSVEQAISRDVTVTYVTNLSQTSEQIFRFEWALSRQFSVVAIRDDNGEFGVDFQYKKRFK